MCNVCRNRKENSSGVSLFCVCVCVCALAEQADRKKKHSFFNGEVILLALKQQGGLAEKQKDHTVD